MYQVVEHAGMDNERVVYEASNYTEVVKYVHSNYTLAEESDLGVDVLKNGSTEF